jgi:hypothetical protein
MQQSLFADTRQQDPYFSPIFGLKLFCDGCRKAARGRGWSSGQRMTDLLGRTCRHEDDNTWSTRRTRPTTMQTCGGRGWIHENGSTAPYYPTSRSAIVISGSTPSSQPSHLASPRAHMADGSVGSSHLDRLSLRVRLWLGRGPSQGHALISPLQVLKPWVGT